MADKVQVTKGVWVSENERGEPVMALVSTGPILNPHRDYGRMVRYVPEAEARGAAQREWISVEELPDSDVMVLLYDNRKGYFCVGELEITDDSEGHGEPYWETASGPMPIARFTHWCRLGPLPPPPEAT